MERSIQKNTVLIPKFSNILILGYVVFFLLVNWLDLRFVRTFDVVTTTGTFFVGASFCMLIIITEVYGYKLARLAIWWNVVLSILLIALGDQFTTITGSSLILYNNIIISSTKLIIASVISAFFSQHLNAFFIAKMKINIRGEHLMSRIILPTILFSGLDSFLVNLIAFYDAMNISHLISIIMSTWFIKILIIFVTAPIMIKLCRKLKSIEKIDIYDINTRFNPLATEADYTDANNFFNRTFGVKSGNYPL